MPERRMLRVGSRGSRLAVEQTQLVLRQLDSLHPHLFIETAIIQTTGDRVHDRPFSQIGSKGLFVKEIEDQLVHRQIDFAVHSAKDMTAVLHEATAIAAVLERGNPYDLLVAPQGMPFDQLPSGCVIGTSSIRRRAFLKARRSDVEFVELRGNVDTRLGKLNSSGLDAVVLAAAGLQRLGLKVAASMLPAEILPPAPAQGAIAVQARTDDPFVLEVLSALNHGDSYASVTAERAFAAACEGGCSVPLGALATTSAGETMMFGSVCSLTGDRVLSDEGTGRDAQALGAEVARRLLARGADKILAELRSVDVSRDVPKGKSVSS